MNSSTSVGQVMKGHLVYWESFAFESPIQRMGLVREVFEKHLTVEMPDRKTTVIWKERVTGWDHCTDAFYFHR